MASDAHVVGFAAAVSVGAWLARPLPLASIVVVAGMAALAAAGRRPVLVGVCLAVVACGLGGRAVAGLTAPAVGPFGGWVTLVSDPDPGRGGVQVVVTAARQRMVVFAYGGAGKRLARMSAGERVWMEGSRRQLPVARRERWMSRHVAVELRIATVGDRLPGAAYTVAANRVRSLLAAAVVHWPPVERSLFLGFVIGDDRAQPDDLVADFRRAGLSHLTAVSGQNVAFVLVVGSPLLRRLRPATRWAATLALVAWFAALTRFEPSVLRASAMAALAATAFWRGWQARPIRLLALAVAGLTLVDPLLVHSVGWWLSVGATGGLALLASPLADRLPGPRWVAEPLAVTLAAQAGVAPVSVAVFGSAPLLAPLANILAVPVAGFVMVWGIPTGVLAGALPAVAPLAGIPSLVATRWVAVVARLAGRAEPGWPPGVALGCQSAVVAVFVAIGRRRRARRDPSSPTVPDR